MVGPRSTHIGHKAARSLYYAIGEQADRIGLPLTHHVTINFSLTDIDPEKATEVFALLRRNRFDKWARRPCKGVGRAFTPAWAYCFENSRKGMPFETMEPGDAHNVHVHWLVHIPAERVHDFEMRLFQWLDGFCRNPSQSEAIDITRIYHAKGLRRYVLTGTDENWARRYGATHERQGLIIGRRSGTSINLGNGARLALDRKLGVTRRAA